MLIQALPPVPVQLPPLPAHIRPYSPATAADVPPAGDRLQLSALPAGLLKPPSVLFPGQPVAPPAVAPPAQGAVSGKVSLDLLSLNVYALPKPVGKNIAQRSAVIGSTLGRYDIAALQETFSGDTRAIGETLSATFAGPNWQTFRPENRFLGTSGLQIFSRYPIIAKDFKPFRYASDEDALAKKGVAFTRIQVPGIGPVDVYDTHYQANGDDPLPWHEKALRKVASLVQPGLTMTHDAIRRHDNQIMAELVKKHDQGYPTFILGDFNASDKSQIVPELIQQLGLKDSFRELHPDDPGFSSDGVLNPIKGGKSRSRLDYVLYRPGKDVDVRPVLSELAYNKPGEYVSDHFGVHTRFELSKKSA